MDLARHVLEGGDLMMVDEFTSVIDRQVAKIGCHAVQKLIRKQNKQFVAVTCHYDVVEWLQPDWMLEPATMSFQWRSLQRRPPLDVEIARVGHDAWKLFAPFHYLTAELDGFKQRVFCKSEICCFCCRSLLAITAVQRTQIVNRGRGKANKGKPESFQ